MHSIDSPRYFPSPERADASGLVLVGGRLDVPWLLDAYRHGIFPWPMDEQRLLWCSPDPRAILELDKLVVHRRLARTLRGERFEATCNREFAAVIDGCATTRERAGNTWITPAMREAYLRLHAAGHAHSIEVWREGALAGGLYGVSTGGAFSAESMFYVERDASKIALVRLVQHLRARGYRLLDVQQGTSHSRRQGAKLIPRNEFLRRLVDCRDDDVTFGDRLCSLDEKWLPNG